MNLPKEIVGGKIFWRMTAREEDSNEHLILPEIDVHRGGEGGEGE